MKLTKEQWKKLESMSIDERLERLEELVDNLIEINSQRELDKFNKEMQEISDDCDNWKMWIFTIAMILVWCTIWILICKAFVQ